MNGGSRKWRWGAIALALMLLGYVGWSTIVGWAPSREEYPVQGIAISEANGEPNWPMLGATGVDFAYITASEGTKGSDKAYQTNLDGAKQAGIRYGAIHHFDICRLATDQATLFITTVPREANALPPAVQLDFTEQCTSRPNRPLILSELATFLSQIEAHSGVPAILLISRDFEEEYKVSSAIDRNVWAEANWFLPDYTARPWVMWTANNGRHIDGVEGPMRWVVVK